ncbi:MAG: hypothetical protein ACRCT8_17695 [Lacipirellulaceae bacterium]
MPDPSPPSPRPADPVGRIDWLALAPWLLLLRTPGIVVGWPWLIAAVVAVVVGPWPERLPIPRVAALLESPFAAPIGGFSEFFASWFAQGPDAALLRVAAWSCFGLVAAAFASQAWTLGESRGVLATTRLAARRIPRLFATAGLVAAPALVAVTLLWLVGFVARIDFLAPVVAIGWPVKLVAGGAVSVLGTAAIAGWPLALAAIAVDNADPFDAASRMYAYALQRMARIAWYATVAAVIGVFSAALVELAAEATVAATNRFVSAGHGAPMTGAAASIAHWWEGVFRRAVAGYYPAYVFTAGVGVYLLLRSDIDGQPVDERADP